MSSLGFAALFALVAAWAIFYIAGHSYGTWAHDAIAAAVMSFVYLVLRRIES